MLATSGAIDSGLLGMLGVLCLVILTLTWWRRSQQRRTTARALTREQRARLRDQEQLRQSLAELLTQLEETAARVDAQIAARTTKLEDLLRQVDQRALGNVSAVKAGDQHQRVYKLADQGATALAIAEALQMPIGEVELILNVRSFSARPTCKIKGPQSAKSSLRNDPTG